MLMKRISTLIIIGISFILNLNLACAKDVFEIEQPIEKAFLISAYYSPLPDQAKYFQGNYKNEVLLNGPGKVTASGSSVYKGIIAAPRSIPFGTIIEVENQGFYKVEDRGSAIIHGDESIRLDLWKGFGEDALDNALNWGLRDRKGWIYPQEVNNLTPYYFSSNIEKGSESEEVKILQKQLKALGFYDHGITGYYGEITEESVFQFQLFKNIVPNREYLGAGRLGPGTRNRLNLLNKALDLLKKNKKEANITNPPSEFHRNTIKDFYDRTISYEDIDYNVYILQQKLNGLGYFSWPRFTYQYLDATKDAVFKFQKAYGLVDDLNQIGAGVFGPATRAKMRKVLGD